MSLHPTQQLALDKSIKALRGLGAKFHVVLPDGTVFGEPVLPEKVARTKRGLAGPRNGHYLMEMLGDTKPGEVREVKPQEGDTLQRLASNLTAFCTRNWGPNSYTSATEAAKGVVSVFRHAE